MTTRIARNAPFWLASLVGVAAMVAALNAVAALSPSSGDQSPVADPSPGELLVAADSIQDPRFFHSVILLVRHDQNFALGIAINKPIAEEQIANLLADAKRPEKDAAGKGAAGTDKPDSAIQGTIRVFLGGPVQPQLGFVIHSADYHSSETVVLTDAVSMTATKGALRDIGLHRGPAKYLFALGYAGWGAGQLDAEVARHDWFTAPATPDLVFDIDRATVWEKALARRTQEL